MTPSEIEPATFGFVAQHLSHCATAVRTCWFVITNLLNNKFVFQYLSYYNVYEKETKPLSTMLKLQ